MIRPSTPFLFFDAFTLKKNFRGTDARRRRTLLSIYGLDRLLRGGFGCERFRFSNSMPSVMPVFGSIDQGLGWKGLEG
jgi:hypothetical protein